MATTIRLTRMGKKKRPFYRLVVLDSRKRRDGAYLANLGYYNPFVEPHEVDLHGEEILSWLEKGAEVRDTARSLLKREGILYQFSLIKQGMSAEDVAAKMEAWQPGRQARIERQVDAEKARRRQIEEAEQKRRDDVAKAEEKEAAAKEAAATEAAAAKEAAATEAAAAKEAAAAEAGEEAAADEPAAEEATKTPVEGE